MSVLLQRQQLFASLVPRLIDAALGLGFGVTLGETRRPRTILSRLTPAGVGSPRSLHPDGLAIDVHLFRGDVYLTRTEDHSELGAIWKGLHPLCRWGGDFSRPDGNHYSVTYQGRA
jgi:hypothetical protein